MKKHILFICNSSDYFISHRLPLAIAAKDAGHTVSIACPDNKNINIIQENNLVFYKIRLTRDSQNIIKEIIAFISIFLLFIKLRPNLIHLITIKPVLYGGIVARLTRISAVVSAIPGLGTVFLADSWLARLRRWFILYLYSVVFRHPNHVIIFQNPDDRDMFLSNKIIKHSQTKLILGSGVNLTDYSYLPEPVGSPVVAMVARLLQDKGVFEFIEAAKLLHERNINVTMRLIGSPDPSNPSTISEQYFSFCKNLTYVQLLGYRKNIAEQYTQCHIACLPSYREGLPKSLIEAAACGRAIVTTDVPGCRDTIILGVTGLLVPAKNSTALADAIQQLIENPEQRKAMGVAGRKLAEKIFSIECVIKQHLDIYEESLAYLQ